MKDHLYTATVQWQRREGEAFTDNRYHREHVLRFDGGIEVAGSSSPSVVPLPYSTEAAIDPEEMFVASLSACHMLWFLSLAAKAGVVVERYDDNASGVMSKNAEGKWWVSAVTLRPQVTLAAGHSTAPLIDLHHRAHGECFIANSVRTEVLIKTTVQTANP
jgi:organic hydroperoxide reductase OsmC/OhrA